MEDDGYNRKALFRGLYQVKHATYVAPFQEGFLG